MRAPGRKAALIGLALVVLVIAGVQLWLRYDVQLRPVVVMRDADAAALLRPSLVTRVVDRFGRPVSADSRPRLVALTFDDGPYPVETPLLLQTLHDLGVPATFFLIGRDAEEFPALARAIEAGGHEIADHTLTHPNLDQLGAEAVRGELRDGAAALERIAPDPAERRLFRPPHGRYTVATIRAAQAAGYDTILWSDDPGDWRSIDAAAIRAHVFRRATAPEILLLHSGRQETVAALPEIVDRYRRAGYTFVTVGTLLRRTTAEQLNRPARLPLE